MKTCLKVRLTFFDMHKCLSTPWQVAVDHVTHSYDSYWNHFCSSSLISFLISPCFVAEISILVNHLPEYFLQLSPKGRIPCIPNLTGLDQDEVSRAPKEGIRKQQKQLLPLKAKSVAWRPRIWVSPSIMVAAWWPFSSQSPSFLLLLCNCDSCQY